MSLRPKISRSNDSIKSERLQFALKLAEPCIDGSGLFPTSPCFCFEPERVYGYDGVSAIIVGLDTGLHCALRADILLRFVALAGGSVQLKPGDNGTVDFRSGHTRAELPSLPPDQYTFVEPGTGKNSISFPGSDELLDALQVCAAGVAKDSHFKAETAVTLCTGENSALYGTDGTSLIKVTMSQPLGDDDRHVLIPKSVCDQIMSIVTMLKCSSENINFTIGSQHVAVAFDHDEYPVKLVGNLLAEKVNLESFEKVVTDAAGKMKPIEIGDDFVRAVDHVSAILAAENEKMCRLEVSETELVVSGEGVLGKARTVIDIKGGQKVEAIVDPERLTKYREFLSYLVVNPDRVAMYDSKTPTKSGLVYVMATFANVVSK